MTNLREMAKQAHIKQQQEYVNTILFLIPIEFKKIFKCAPERMYFEPGGSFYAEKDGIKLTCVVHKNGLNEGKWVYSIEFRYKDRTIYSLADLGRVLCHT
jgi:hypothetical protein